MQGHPSSMFSPQGVKSEFMHTELGSQQRGWERNVGAPISSAQSVQDGFQQQQQRQIYVQSGQHMPGGYGAENMQQSSQMMNPQNPGIHPYQGGAGDHPPPISYSLPNEIQNRLRSLGEDEVRMFNSIMATLYAISLPHSETLLRESLPAKPQVRTYVNKK